MIYVFAGIVLGLALWALREELQPGGALRSERLFQRDGELLEFPLVEGWDRDDILLTLAEIEGL